MTAAQFRVFALSLPDCIEASHHDHPDFRVRGKIFATLGYPTRAWGMVAVTPWEQARMCRGQPDVFMPAPGAWGRAGSTLVHLRPAPAPIVREAIQSAWRKRRQTRVRRRNPKGKVARREEA
jgi:hypothetical protein